MELPAASPLAGRKPSSIRALGLPLCALIFAASGCEEEGQPPPPGAEGPVLIRQWEAKNEDPVTVLAKTVHQLDTHFRDLDLRPVLVRMPFSEGVVYIAAPQAVYKASSRNAVRLEDGVQMIGTYRNDPWVGRADRALLNPDKHTLVFDDSEWYYRGAVHRAHRTTIDRKAITDDSNTGSTAPPAVICALYALPQPLFLPELQKPESEAAKPQGEAEEK